MTRAAERKRTVPCELCDLKREEEGGSWWCRRFACEVTSEDGCTFGDLDG